MGKRVDLAFDGKMVLDARDRLDPGACSSTLDCLGNLQFAPVRDGRSIGVALFPVGRRAELFKLVIF